MNKTLGTRRLQQWMVPVLALLALSALAGKCSEEEPPVWTEIPSGFVEVIEGSFVLKAVSPDGSAIGIRQRLNPEGGDLAFWTEVFELEMVEAKGYKLIEKKDVESADGVAGRVLTFEFAEGETPYHYSIAIYLTEKSLVTVETATELANLERYAGAFEAARNKLNAKLGDPGQG